MPENTPIREPRLHLQERDLIAQGVDVRMFGFVENVRPPFHAARFEVLPGCRTPLDQHSVQECWIILKGSGLLEHEGRQYPVMESDIFYFASFERHTLINDRDRAITVLSIYW
ncbi:hypothetical protein AQUSIP_25450 [Aquicella siphonis]|uniref:Cupin type-2 domain-containing protein n=1 Tax=Aquicella siphonis TaxID=254247 RepID=A0A5E4PKY7_9COXI|nr:cupin domain-containing protein [Aquicella siphonis]VVC77218.1 hypothetical protein AQUSIP_25450 [Aquicella siphonis]